jgi:hypothetical protein
MIKLNLGISKGDVDVLTFETKAELLDFVKDLKRLTFINVFLVTDDSEFGEILITEKLEKVIQAIEMDYIDISNFHIHEYESYESAYAVALMMREPNGKCYDQ